MILRLPRSREAVPFVTGAVVLTALYLGSIQMDRWAAVSFAQPLLAAMLLAVLQAGLFLLLLGVAPALARGVGRVVGAPPSVPSRVPLLPLGLAGMTAGVVVYFADLVAWLGSTGAANVSWSAVAVGASIAAVMGLAAGGVAAAIASCGGDAPGWRFRLRAVRSPMAGLAGLGLAAIPLAAAVPLRARLLSAPLTCAAVDTVLLLVSALAFTRGERLASNLRSPGWRTAGLVLSVAALVACVVAGELRPLLLPTGLLDLAYLGAFVILGVGAAFALPSAPPAGVRHALPITLLLGLSALVLAESVPSLAAGAPSEVRPARWVVVDVAGSIDLDGDGYSFFFGPDCDDLDPDRGPDVPEIPGNGIDDNCRGGDRLARLPWRPRAAFVPLPASVPPPRHVLLLTVDALRADRLSAYGYSKQTSPNIDRLARSGVLFRRAYSNSPLTRYAIPMLLTGRLVSEIEWNPELFPVGMGPGNNTVAEVLRKTAGFRTAVFQTVYSLSSRWGMNRGFEHVDESLILDPSTQRGGITSDRLVDRALAWLEEHREDRSFVWMHFLDPHAAYLPHPGIPDFGDDASGRYDGEVAFTDREIGRLLDRLRAMGREEETAVILLSDHGEMLGEHGATKHGGSLVWEETLRIPLIVRVPGLPPREVECVTGHRDVASTILNLVGIDGTAHGLTSATLVPDLLGRCEPNREIVAELNGVGVLVGPRYKYVSRGRGGATELYDLARDPLERNDLATRQRIVARRMKTRLAAWREVATRRTIQQAMERFVLPRLPAGASPLDARFDNGIELAGADLGSRRLDPNHPLRIALYLRGTRSMREPCLVQVAMRRGTRRVRVEGAGRHAPISGMLPFAYFPRGRLVEDVFHLRCKHHSGKLRASVALACPDGIVPARGRDAREGWVQLGEIEATCPPGRTSRRR